MSVKKDVIAEVLGISEREVTCGNCARSNADWDDEFFGECWCEGWKRYVGATGFCSFFCTREVGKK